MHGATPTPTVTHTLTKPPLGGSLMCGSLALNVLGLAMPLVMLQIFDRIIPNASEATLFFFLIGLCCVALGELILRVARIFIVADIGRRFETSLSDATFSHVLRSVPSDHEKSTLGQHFERFGAIAQLRETYAGQGRLLVVDLPFTVIFVAMIWFIGGSLVIIPLGVLAVIFVAATVMRWHQARVLETRKLVDGRRYSFLIEFLAQIATAKTNRSEPQMLRRYEMLIAQSLAASRKIIWFSGVSQSVGAILGQAAVAAMGLYGAWCVVTGLIGVGELAACMLLNGRITQPMLRLLGVMMQGESATIARGKLTELAATPVQRAIAEPAPLKGGLRLCDLALAHPRAGQDQPEGLTADIAPGARVLLADGGGGAATALLRYILAEQAPARGIVRIDGAPPVLHAANRGVGGIVVLESRPIILRGSIFENLTLFGAVRDVSLAMQLCGDIGIDADVRKLPDGYQTILGPESGVRSEGFLQRVALVRALAMTPRLLLFNRATSSLDCDAARLAVQALDRHAGAGTVLYATEDPEIGALSQTTVSLAPMTRAAAIRDWDEDLRRDQDMAALLQKAPA